MRVLGGNAVILPKGIKPGEESGGVGAVGERPSNVRDDLKRAVLDEIAFLGVDGKEFDDVGALGPAFPVDTTHRHGRVDIERFTVVQVPPGVLPEPGIVGIEAEGEVLRRQDGDARQIAGHFDAEVVVKGAPGRVGRGTADEPLFVEL